MRKKGNKLIVLSTIIFLMVCFFTYLLGKGLNIEKSLAAIPVTKITIIPSSRTINVGGSISLFANIEPSNTTDTITWSSSNNSVATVNSNGLVTGKSAGRAVITVSASSGVKATSVITVKKASTPKPSPTPTPTPEPKTILVTEIELKPSILSIEVEEEANLYATIVPDDATDKTLTWISDNSSIVEVISDGLIVGRSVGTATITVKSSNGKTASTVVTVSKNAGIIEETSSKEPSIYIPPEKSNSSINVSMKLLILASVMFIAFVSGAVSYFVIKNKNQY